MKRETLLKQLETNANEMEVVGHEMDTFEESDDNNYEL